MSSKSVQTTAGNLSSVHAHKEETSLASSNKVETIEEEKQQRTLLKKQFKMQFKTQFKPKTWN